LLLFRGHQRQESLLIRILRCFSLFARQVYGFAVWTAAVFPCDIFSRGVLAIGPRIRATSAFPGRGAAASPQAMVVHRRPGTPVCPRREDS
jgi:hypothetical protein